MGNPVDQYTHSMSVRPTGKPNVGFSVHWNKETRQLEFSGTFEVAAVLKYLAGKGYIEIKKLPEGEDQYQTMQFAYPVPNEQAARILAFGEGYGFLSMLMGIASDLAKSNK